MPWISVYESAKKTPDLAIIRMECTIWLFIMYAEFAQFNHHMHILHHLLM